MISFCCSLLYNNLVVFVFLVTFAAINGSVMTRFKRNLIYSAARCAYDFKHFSLRFHTLFSCSSAFLASGRVIFKALFSIKLLFAGCEYKFLTAILTNQRLVFIHNILSFQSISLFLFAKILQLFLNTLYCIVYSLRVFAKNICDFLIGTPF